MKYSLGRYAWLLCAVLVMAACTHLERPTEIVGTTDRYLDWGTSPPPAQDRARHVIEGPRPFEWWYFDGHLDNGDTFVGVFLDPSFTTGKPGAAFSLYGPDWSKETRLVTLEAEEITSSLDDAGIRSSAGFLRRLNDTTYRVYWKIDGLEADLTLSTLAPGWMPKGDDGVNESALDFFWTIHQAKNRITGTITRDGVSREVTGTGYADHNWGRRPLYEITRRWVWGRIIAGDYTIVYADVDYYNPSIESRPLYIAKGDTMIVGTGSPTIRQENFVTDPVLGRHYPSKITVDFENGGTKAHIDITLKAVVENVDLLTMSDLNPVAQWAARTFIFKPTYFRVIADYEGTIEYDGITDDISGECLYEVMGFE